jgi:hypothetical protein
VQLAVRAKVKRQARRVVTAAATAQQQRAHVGEEAAAHAETAGARMQTRCVLRLSVLSAVPAKRAARGARGARATHRRSVTGGPAGGAAVRRRDRSGELGGV